MGEPFHQVGGKIVIEGRYGTLTIDPESNTYTYKTNENADRLGLDADGNPQAGTDEFTIYVRDEHGAWTAKPISVTVTGSNDTPTITADDAEHWVRKRASWTPRRTTAPPPTRRRLRIPPTIPAS
ncbi:MAG: VCBS domain-containing protein [Bilophila wadsworthia]